MLEKVDMELALPAKTFRISYPVPFYEVSQCCYAVL